jgi:hypothetical protein
VAHDALVDLMINNHYETIRLHCITISNAPIIVGLPWLRKHNPNIDCREGCITINSAMCAKECLFTSPHAKTMSEEKAMGEYYRDTAWDVASQEAVCSISMVDAETFEEELEDGMDRTMPLEYIEEILDAWEAYHADLGMTEQREREPVEGLMTRDIVPKEYHEYLYIFEAKDDWGLPPHRYYDHQIPLLDGKALLFERIWALDKKRLWALKEYLETNVEQGWLCTSTSPASAPIHFVQKKDGSLRLCVDYRGLNAMTVKDRTPLPLISEALDQLGNAKLYTKLDVKDANHNLRIAERDELKTAFRTKYGLYNYLVMPFGLTNAPTSCQRWINEILSDYRDIFCIAYLDNILIYSDNLEQHHQYVHLILKRFEEVGLTLKPSKSEFHTDRTEYLGYIISPMGIQMDPEDVQTVAEWKEPVNVKRVQSFLGFANFYRQFINDFCKITIPLTWLTQKETP